MSLNNPQPNRNGRDPLDKVVIAAQIAGAIAAVGGLIFAVAIWMASS